MSHKWQSAHVFERFYNVYSFSRHPLQRNDCYSHIFIPWVSDLVEDLMFKIKAQLNDHGKCYIPFMQKDMSVANLSEKEFESIKKQLSNNVETHLYMSNMDSIHVWKVSQVLKGNDLPVDMKDLSIKCFEKKMSEYTYWFVVDDLFVLRAAHIDDVQEEVSRELDLLNESEQTYQIFAPIQQLAIRDDADMVHKDAYKWIEINRSLTYDYFIRSCELEDNIYQENWELLSRATQHCLIAAEQTRHKAILYRDIEKFNFLRESFEYYLSAVVNELNEIYIRPFISAFHEYECMIDVWNEVQESFVNPTIQNIINQMIDAKGDHISSLPIFLNYMKTAKSFLFSLRSKFSKRIAKEEFLHLENFILRQEGLVESFLCRNLEDKIKAIIDVRVWLKDISEKAEHLSKSELKSVTSKLTHLLNIMASCDFEDNILFEVIEEKTSKGHIKKTLLEEVRGLVGKMGKIAS